MEKNPKELLKSVGYILDDNIKKKEDYFKYKKYYEKSEQLCKFGRYNACERYNKLFYIYKKDINNIKRTDFDSPNRHDEYMS